MKLHKHSVVVRMASFKRLFHLMLENKRIKYVYLCSGDLYDK